MRASVFSLGWAVVLPIDVPAGSVEEVGKGQCCDGSTNVGCFIVPPEKKRQLQTFISIQLPLEGAVCQSNAVGVSSCSQNCRLKDYTGALKNAWMHVTSFVFWCIFRPSRWGKVWLDCFVRMQCTWTEAEVSLRVLVSMLVLSLSLSFYLSLSLHLSFSESVQY